MYPSFQSNTCLLGDFKLYWALGFLLHHNGPRGHSLAMSDIAHTKLG